MPYAPKTRPFAHQQKWFDATKDQKAFAVLWEQGTGKSKLTIDTAGHLYTEGKIDCLLVIAPNGVHRNWTANEVPTHLGSPAQEKALCFCWQSPKATTQWHKKEADESVKHRGFLIVALSYDATMTAAGYKYLQRLLTARKVFAVLDESARIKNPTAKRTMRMVAMGKHVAWKRVLTGTPVSNSPFDIFSQLSFLSSDIWRPIGCSTFTAFKTFFGIWADRMDPRSGRKYRELVKYRNLDLLQKTIEGISTRVTKADVLDLPDKLYTKRYFDLGPKQTAHYVSMKKTYQTLLASTEVTAMLAITQLLRLQQITSGFIVDDDSVVRKLEENPRLDTLIEVVEETQGKMIIWAKFRHEIDQIMEALYRAQVSAVRYDGNVDAKGRAEAIDAFQGGTARAFVANPAAAGEGLTLHAATTVIYYSNSFKLTDRLQSEDRAHRIGQKHNVTYVDLVASHTVDEKIVEALRGKLDIASIVTGDTVKEWI